MTTLTGEYLELRRLPETDLPHIWKVYQGTPLYFDALGMRVDDLTLADVRAQWTSAQANPQRTLFGVYHLVTGLVVGAADVTIGSPNPDSAAVWLLIWGGFQRQGYGQECMALLESWLLSEPGVTTLCAIAAENEEGLSFLELQGFRHTELLVDPPVGRGRSFWMCW